MHLRFIASILVVLVLLALTASQAFADSWVDGYYRSNGTYVGGYYRSDPDGYRWNNYSYSGNVNPYTGAVGSKSYSSYSSYSYPSYSSRSYYYSSYSWDW